MADNSYFLVYRRTNFQFKSKYGAAKQKLKLRDIEASQNSLRSSRTDDQIKRIKNHTCAQTPVKLYVPKAWGGISYLDANWLLLVYFMHYDSLT